MEIPSLYFKETRTKLPLAKPPRKHGRPIGKKWDNADLYSANIPSVMPFSSEVGFCGNYDIWAIVGKKWVYISKPQRCKISQPKKLKIKKLIWEKMISDLLSNAYAKRHGGDYGIFKRILK